MSVQEPPSKRHCPAEPHLNPEDADDVELFAACASVHQWQQAHQAISDEPFVHSCWITQTQSAPTAEQYSNALYSLGALRERRSELAPAIEQLQLAVGIWPGNTLAAYELALLLSSVGQVSAAAQAMHAAVDSGPAADRVRQWACCHVCIERHSITQLARYQLALLLCQTAEHAAANKLLHELGFQFRLSDQVLARSKCQKQPISAGELVRVFDRVLPDALLSKLTAAFHSESPFWSAHQYDEPTQLYFSYYVDLTKPDLPQSTVIQQLAYLMKQELENECPLLKEAKGAEWWVHKRGHGNAHQLHWDTDENFLQSADGGVRHPLMSAVLFLSEDDIGGPLFVANQVLHGQLADNGWLVPARKNRLVIFRGDLLHGVLPAISENLDGSSRITFVIGWWGAETPQKHIRVAEGPHGACMAECGASSEPVPEWLRLLEPVSNGEGFPNRASVDTTSLAVSPVWTPVEPTGRRAGRALAVPAETPALRVQQQRHD